MRFAVVCRCAVDVISFIIIVLLFITLWQCELHGISYKRVFFCNDRSIRYPYKDGSVPTYAVVILVIPLPIIIVSLPHTR